MHLGASNIDEVVDEYGRDGALDAFIASLSEDIPGGNEDAEKDTEAQRIWCAS